MIGNTPPRLGSGNIFKLFGYSRRLPIGSMRSIRLCISSLSSSADRMIASPNVDTMPPKADCIGSPDATFIARSRVIMPLPLSPAAANMVGTPSGIVPLIRYSCSGARPTK